MESNIKFKKIFLNIYIWRHILLFTENFIYKLIKFFVNIIEKSIYGYIESFKRQKIINNIVNNIINNFSSKILELPLNISKIGHYIAVQYFQNENIIPLGNKYLISDLNNLNNKKYISNYKHQITTLKYIMNSALRLKQFDKIQLIFLLQLISLANEKLYMRKLRSLLEIKFYNEFCNNKCSYNCKCYTKCNICNCDNTVKIIYIKIDLTKINIRLCKLCEKLMKNA